MRNLFWFCIFTVFIAGCQTPDNSHKTVNIDPATMVNIVANGDLEIPDPEAGEIKAPESWKPFNYGGGATGKHAYEQDPTTRNSVVRITLDEPGAAGWSQQLRLSPDSHWLMTCRTKADSIQGRGLGATLIIPEFRYMQPPFTRRADQWTTLSKELFNAGFVDLTLTCSLGPYGGNTGTAFFDDISLIKQINPAHDPRITKALNWGAYQLRFNTERGYITSLKLTDHPRTDALDFLGSYPTLPYLDHQRDHFLGDVALDIHHDGQWQRFTTADADVNHTIKPTDRSLVVTHAFPENNAIPDIETAFTLQADNLQFQIRLTNRSPNDIVIGSVDLPLPWNNNYCLFDPHDKNSQRLLYTRRVAEHKHIGGVSSAITVCPMDGSSPMLAVIPADNQSGLEFTYHSPDTIREQRRDPGRWIHGAWPGMTRICFHSKGVKDRNQWVDWYLGHTSLTLSPGQSRQFTLELPVLNHRDDVYQAMANNSGLGVRLIPGPAAPVGQPVELVISGGCPPFQISGREIDNLTPVSAPDANATVHTAAMVMRSAGEQVITITDAENRSATIIAMGLAPVDTLLERRSDFIMTQQYHIAEDDLLSGGFLCWDNRAGHRLAQPDDMWGSGGYEGGITDAQFMARKNVSYPDSDEIKRLESYIHNWLRGRLQNPDTNGVAWTVKRPKRTERGYNYIHVLNLFDAMARVAMIWPDQCQYDCHHYLDLWMNTFQAFNTRAVRFRDLGLMGRGNFVYMPELLRRMERDIDAQEVEREIAHWVEYWVTPPAYPYGSELFFDNTGYETVALYCDYDAQHNKALTADQVNQREDLVNQTIAVTEAGRGREPSWFWNDSDQRWWDAVRTAPEYNSFTDFGENCHHYMTGLNGYMLLDLYDRQYNSDDRYPVGFSGMLTHLGRITESGFAGMCTCPDPSSDNYGLNQFTGDVGLGLWGGLLGLRCYLYDDSEVGNRCLGGRLTRANDGSVTVSPWSGCDRRLRWMVDGSVAIDVEGQVIRSVTRKENGKRWIIQLSNPAACTSRSRLVMQGLTNGEWAISHRINNGSELESIREDLFDHTYSTERTLKAGTSMEIILALE